MSTDIEKVYTEQVGVIPMVAEYLTRMDFINVIDTVVKPLRSNNRRLTHGQTAFVLILYLVCRPHCMYKVEEWVNNTSYLKILIPDIKGEYLSDDRIEDTLKAIFNAKVKNLFGAQTINIIKAFNLNVSQVHCDFTSFSVHGDYENWGEDCINITYGYSKDHRKDKKQFVQEVTVTNDGGVPIGTQSLDGNSADVSNYIPAWKKIKEEIGTTNFLTIGDCKLSSDENLLTIMKSKGYFVAPLAMYSTLKKDLIKYVTVEKKPLELLKQTKQNENLTVSYSGFEVDAQIVDKETGKEYPYRQIFVYSSQLNELRLKSMNERIAKSIEEIDDFKEKIKYGKKYDCVEKVSDKISSILKKHNCGDLINFTINEETIVTKKKIGRGRSTSTSEYTYTEKKIYTVNHSLNAANIEIEEKICGYFVLGTNKSKKELSMKKALGCYKQEWQVEKIFDRLKGPLQVIPIYLKDPRHIEAMMYLLVTCAQIFTLIDREAKNTLAADNERLSGLFPNKVTTKNPKMEQIIDKFTNISLVYVEKGSERNCFISELTPVHRKLLEITHTSNFMYNSNYVGKKLENAECDLNIQGLIGIG